MSRIIVLTTTYLNKPYANGVCARNIVRALRSAGHTVNVVCFEDKVIPEEDIGQVCCIPKPPKRVTGDNSLFRRIGRTIKAIKKPEMDEQFVDNYFNITNKLLQTKCFDVLITMFFPIEGLEATSRIKQVYPGIKTIAYELDSIGDGILCSVRQAVKNRSYVHWQKRVYEQIDHIIIMKSHQVYWKKVFGKRFQGKLLVSDLPVLVQHNQSIKKTDESISMVYSGRIDSIYRSPKYLLSVLSELKKQLFFDFYFYSEGDCETVISEAAKQNSQIHQCGYVCQGELEKALEESDFLINLGNRTSNNVPSKLISYISFGKPIVHFSSQKDDVCRSYLEQYPLALIIDDSMKIDEAAKKLLFFVQSTKGKRLPFNLIESIFQENSPSHSAELITRIL